MSPRANVCSFQPTFLWLLCHLYIPACEILIQISSAAPLPHDNPGFLFSDLQAVLSSFKVLRTPCERVAVLYIALASFAAYYHCCCESRKISTGLSKIWSCFTFCRWVIGWLRWPRAVWPILYSGCDLEGRAATSPAFFEPQPLCYHWMSALSLTCAIALFPWLSKALWMAMSASLDGVLSITQLSKLCWSSLVTWIINMVVLGLGHRNWILMHVLSQRWSGICSGGAAV